MKEPCKALGKGGDAQLASKVMEATITRHAHRLGYGFSVPAAAICALMIPKSGITTPCNLLWPSKCTEEPYISSRR